MNINKFLGNSRRTSVIGKNIYTTEAFLGNRQTYGLELNKQWKDPEPGIRGNLYIGHYTPFKEVLIPHFYENGKELVFKAVRHQWTPAWSKTYYRCTPDESYYPRVGCVSFCEQRCFTTEDVFVSQITISSDKREETEIHVKLESAFSDNRVTADLQKFNNKLKLDGYFALKNTEADSNEFVVKIPPNGSCTFKYAFAFDKTREQAYNKSIKALEKTDPFTEKENAFNDFFKKNVPELSCDDPDMLKMYYYRWFVVYRSIHKPEDVLDNHEVHGDCIYESPYGDGYDCPVGLPVAWHYEECKWMINPDALFSDAENWNRKLDYYWKYYIESTPMAVWNIYKNHPDKDFLERMYDSCKEYSLKDFSPEKGGYEFLPTVTGSWNTGAEYQPAFYQYTDEKWDWRQDVEGIRKGWGTEQRKLYRLDYISYSVGNLIGCANMAAELGKEAERRELQELADRSVEAVKKYFWNEEHSCFVSIDAKTGKQCNESICYDSFFPFLWGMLDKEYSRGFKPLFDKTSFKGGFANTTVDKNCPMYWFDNCIAGPVYSSVAEPHNYGCAWNGPVWPYATCGVTDALGAAATMDQTLQNEWLDLFEGYTELQFLHGDRSVPMVLEHYRPSDGVTFSGTCDYFHSTWVDLFMKYWAGINIDNGKISFKPFTKQEFVLDNVCIGGKLYRFEQTEQDGQLHKNIIEI